LKLYKLTNKDYTTYGGFEWTVGKSRRVKKCKDPQLCSGDVIHAYKDKNLALLLNPIHGNIPDPLLFECTGNIVVEDYGKCGVFSLKIEKGLHCPRWYKNDETRKKVQINFAILCAESVLKHFEKHNSKDKRPFEAIKAAKKYLKKPTEKNKKTAARAARAAHAAYAAYAAANAAANAAYAAANAAYAADAATRAAAYAAHAAAHAADIDFCKLANIAVKEIMTGKYK